MRALIEKATANLPCLGSGVVVVLVDQDFSQTTESVLLFDLFEVKERCLANRTIAPHTRGGAIIKNTIFVIAAKLQGRNYSLTSM